MADQPEMAPLQPVPLQPAPPVIFSESIPKDVVIAWYRGEFAAANAIIDALCGHLGQLSASSNDYDSVFAAIHRRRLSWIPVIQMQHFHSIADVTLELGRVAEKKTEFSKGGTKTIDEELVPGKYDSGLQEMQHSSMSNNICSNHQECEGHSSRIKLTKGFKAKEAVEGYMVNVVKGLKLYEDVFSESEISKLNDFVNDIHAAGQNGELSGDTFILFNKQMKGNKRELIQLGVPIFGEIKDAKSNIEPIPSLLNGVIDHLIQWQIIPEYKRPNGCIINFFEEGEFSQPFLKPPHLDQPLSTLLLSESTMAFGRRILNSENDGNYEGSLMLSLKKGSLLVMRGNSANKARHVMCSSPNRRVSITFFRVKQDSDQGQSPTSSMTTAVTRWQPGIASPFPMPNGTQSGYQAMGMMPKWGTLGAPMVMLTPMCPMALNPSKFRGGTGVFLPLEEQYIRQTRNVPPRLMELPSPIEPHTEETAESSNTGKG